MTIKGTNPDRLTRLLITGGLVLSVIFGYILIDKVHLSPRNVFDRMLSQSLSHKSYTRTIVQKTESESLNNSTFFRFGADPVSLSQITISDGPKSLKTETIGTPSTNFLRSVALEGIVTSPEQQGESTILGKWFKQSAKPEASFYREASYTVLPVGYVPPALRPQLLNFIRDKNVYKIQESETKRISLGARPAYSYTIKVDLAAQVELMQMFASSSGVGRIGALDLQSLPPGSAIEIECVVDKRSATLISLEIKSNNQTETYAGWGLDKGVQVPLEALPFDQLQKSL